MFIHRFVSWKTLFWLFAIAALTFTGKWMTPRLLALYHQIEGGLLLEKSLAAVPDNPSRDILCQPASQPGTDSLQLERAIGHLTKALEYNASLTQADLLLGRAFCLLGKPDEAIEPYREYTHLRPENPLGYIELAGAYEALARLRQKTPEMIQQVGLENQLVEIDVKSWVGRAVAAWQMAEVVPQDFVDTGDSLAKQGDYKQALQWYERALWFKSDYAPAWLGAGQVYQVQDDWQSALTLYRIAWKYNPELSCEPYTLALEHFDDYPGAKQVLQYVLDSYPASTHRPRWWRLLADDLISQKVWDEAARVLETAKMEFPSRVEFYILLGWVYYDRGDGFDAALGQFQQAISLNDRGPDGYYATAQLYNRIGDYGQADSWYDQAIQRNPNRYWYYTARAYNARKAENYALMLDVSLHAESLFPDSPDIYYYLAWAYELNGQVEEAVSAIEKALELRDPPLGSYYLRAGEIYEMAKEWYRALGAYQQVLILDPDNQTALDGVERLKDK
jgi:tetratricopeptide (TPR) repeat protein